MKKFTHTKYMVVMSVYFMLIISTLKVIYFNSINVSAWGMVALIAVELSTILFIAVHTSIRASELGYEQLGYEKYKRGFLSNKLKIRSYHFVYILYIMNTIFDFTGPDNNITMRFIWLSLYLNLIHISNETMYGTEDVFIPYLKMHIPYSNIISLRKNSSGNYILLTEEKEHKLIIDEKECQFFKSKLREVELEEDGL